MPVSGPAEEARTRGPRRHDRRAVAAADDAPGRRVPEPVTSAEPGDLGDPDATRRRPPPTHRRDDRSHGHPRHRRGVHHPRRAAAAHVRLPAVVDQRRERAGDRGEPRRDHQSWRAAPRRRRRASAATGRADRRPPQPIPATAPGSPCSTSRACATRCGACRSTRAPARTSSPRVPGTTARPRCPARSATSRSPRTARPTTSRSRTSPTCAPATRSTSRPATQWYVYTLTKDDPNLCPTDVWVIAAGARQARRHAHAEAHHHDHLHAALRLHRSLGLVGRAHRDEPDATDRPGRPHRHRLTAAAPDAARTAPDPPRATRTDTVYAWMWRKLPGPWPVKLLEALRGARGRRRCCCSSVVFPWLEPRLPFNDVTVDERTSARAPSAAPAHRGARRITAPTGPRSRSADHDRWWCWRSRCCGPCRRMGLFVTVAPPERGRRLRRLVDRPRRPPGHHSTTTARCSPAAPRSSRASGPSSSTPSSSPSPSSSSC